MSDLGEPSGSSRREAPGEERTGGRWARRGRKALPVARRLAIREYLPVAGWTAAWLMIGLAVGHADTVRLLAANTFVQAAKALLTMDVVQLLAKRIGAGREVFRASRRLAVRIDLQALTACAVIIAGLVAFLDWRGMGEVAVMTGVVALGIPARHPGALFAADRDRDLWWRAGVAAVGVAGSAVVLLLGLPWLAAAGVLALRDWGGLLATLLFARRRPEPASVLPEVLSFAEAARRTEATARRRLSYRVVKSLFVVAFGPLGNIAARTGRGAGRLDTRIANLIPRSRPGMLLLTGGTFALSAGLLTLSREPAAVLGAAALARIGASGGSALLWWSYADDAIVEDDDDD